MNVPLKGVYTHENTLEVSIEAFIKTEIITLLRIFSSNYKCKEQRQDIESYKRKD